MKDMVFYSISRIKNQRLSFPFYAIFSLPSCFSFG